MTGGLVSLVVVLDRLEERATEVGFVDLISAFLSVLETGVFVLVVAEVVATTGFLFYSYVC